MQNGLLDSLNGRFRDECLNGPLTSWSRRHNKLPLGSGCRNAAFSSTAEVLNDS
jgi:hypothetical protein